MEVTTIGLDLAKNIFQVHGITEDEEVAFNRPLRRAQLLPFFSKLEPCLIGMEACSSAHHWGRELTALGHDVRLIPPIYVKPYVKRGKSDAIDAEAICEAVTRPTMRFVAIKTVEQQALLSLHRARSLLVRQRTQLINGLRGMVAEFGVYIARGLIRGYYLRALQLRRNFPVSFLVRPVRHPPGDGRRLRRHDLVAEIFHLKEQVKVPLVLNKKEVTRISAMAPSLKAKVMLSLAYGRR